MFKVLLYYDAYDKLMSMVAQLKKIGVDVDSHQQPNQVISQVLEFNADFVIMQAYPQPELVYDLAYKLTHLVKSPHVILFRQNDQALDSAKIMKNNVTKVFAEPVDIHLLMAYLLEIKGLDPKDIFARYLQVDYDPSSSEVSAPSQIPTKFQERDYLNSLSDFDSSELDLEQTLDTDKVLDFKKQLASQAVIETEETERDRFLKALLTGKPT